MVKLLMETKTIKIQSRRFNSTRLEPGPIQIRPSHAHGGEIMFDSVSNIFSAF